MNFESIDLPTVSLPETEFFEPWHCITMQQIHGMNVGVATMCG